METTVYTDTEKVSYLCAIDRLLTSKFDGINKKRYRNFNMLVAELQWEYDSRKILEDEGRPVKAYPILNSIIKNISGYQKGGRKKLGCLGRTPDDVEFAQIMTQIMDYYLTSAGYDQVISRAFLEAIIARWSIIYNGWSFEDDPEGMFALKNYNPFRLKFDMDFTDRGWKDCKYVLDGAMYSIEEIILMYAFHNDDLADELISKSKLFDAGTDRQKREAAVATWLSRLRTTVGSWFSGENRDDTNPNVLGNNDEWYDSLTGRFKVIELHERRLERRFLYYDPATNRKLDIHDNAIDEKGNFDREKLNLFVQESGRDIANVTRALIKQVYVTTAIPAFQMKVQDAPYPVQNGNYCFTPIWGYDFHADIMQTQSVVDELIDVQTDFNKARSTKLEIMARLNVPGIIGEEGFDKGYEDEWLQRKIGSIRHTAKNKFDKWKVDNPMSIPQSLITEPLENLEIMSKISGVNAENEGKSETSNQSGKLFIAKKEQGEVNMQYLFDNLDIAAKIVGRNTVDYIQYYATEERMIRITEDSGNPNWLTINQRTISGIKNDVSKGKFDITISQLPYGATARQVEFLQVSDIIEALVKLFPQLAPQLAFIYVKASDSAYKNEIMEILNQALQGSPEVIQQALAQKAAQQQVQSQELQNDKTVLENMGNAMGVKAEMQGMDMGSAIKQILSEMQQEKGTDLK